MTKLASRLTTALSGDPVLRKHWTDPPSVFIDPPSLRAPGKVPTIWNSGHVATIWLCIGKSDLSVSAIWLVVREVARVLLDTGCLRRLDGVGIIPRYYEPGTPFPERLLRINIASGAVRTLLGLDSDSLMRSKLADGIACGWYVKPPDWSLSGPQAAPSIHERHVEAP